MSDLSIEELKEKIAIKNSEETKEFTISPSPITEKKLIAYEDSFWLSVVILTFGFLISLTMAHLIKKNKNPEVILRSFGTILIIIAAVFLIVAGYSEKQIAPVIGLLGTIAGYILGKSSSEDVDKNTQKAPDNNESKS